MITVLSRTLNVTTFQPSTNQSWAKGVTFTTPRDRRVRLSWTEKLYIYFYVRKEETGTYYWERVDIEECVCVRVFFLFHLQTQRTDYSAILIPKNSHFTPFRERKDWGFRREKEKKNWVFLGVPMVELEIQRRGWKEIKKIASLFSGCFWNYDLVRTGKETFDALCWIEIVGFSENRWLRNERWWWGRGSSGGSTAAVGVEILSGFRGTYGGGGSSGR